MFARVSTFQGSPNGSIEEAIRDGQERVLPAAQKLPGFKGLLFLMQPETGKSLAITLWETEDSMRASEAAATQIREEGATATGDRIVGVERYQVALDVPVS